MTARALALPLLGLALWSAAPAPAFAAPVPQDAAKPEAKPDAKPAAPKAPKGLGEVAPVLEEVEWVQGKPIKQYKRGDTYLIVFLAPSSQATPKVLREMLTLQDDHTKDRVQVIGVCSRQDPQFEPVATYMKRRPESAKLMIARDKNDATLKAWTELIGNFGDATAVLVDKKGKVAWHGGVFEDLEAALPAVLSDDSAALSKLVEARRAIDKSAKEQFDALNKAAKDKQWDKVVTAADAVIALDPRAFASVGISKYRALVIAGKKADAATYGRELVNGPLHDDEGGLNELAWYIVDPDARLSDSARDSELALLAAQRGCELSSELDAPLLDTLARAHWRLGQRPEAIDLQKKAVSLAFGSDTKTDLQKSLDEYLKTPAPVAAPAAASGEATGSPGASGAPASPAPSPPPAPPGAPTPPPPGPDSGGDKPKN